MGADRLDVSTQVEHASHAVHDRGQCPHRGEADGDREARACRLVTHLRRAEQSFVRHAAPVHAVGDPLDALDLARGEVGQHRRPIVRRPVAQPQRYAGLRGWARRARRHRLAAQRARRAPEHVAERLVEPPHAAEAGGESHVRHRHARLLDQLLREQHATRLGYGDRRQTLPVAVHYVAHSCKVLRYYPGSSPG